MTDWFTTSGRVVYDPHRGDMKRRVERWCVIEVDKEITAYFRWFLERNWWECDRRGLKRTYHRPSWDAHVSVVRGERLANADQWTLHHGQRVDIEYNNVIRQTGDTTGFDRPDHFWFVDVRCPLINTIRGELGLPIADFHTGKPYRNHLTIARAYE